MEDEQRDALFARLKKSIAGFFESDLRKQARELSAEADRRRDRENEIFGRMKIDRRGLDRPEGWSGQGVPGVTLAVGRTNGMEVKEDLTQLSDKQLKQRKFYAAQDAKALGADPPQRFMDEAERNEILRRLRAANENSPKPRNEVLERIKQALKDAQEERQDKRLVAFFKTEHLRHSEGWKQFDELHTELTAAKARGFLSKEVVLNLDDEGMEVREVARVKESEPYEKRPSVRAARQFRRKGGRGG